jgi:hypothetical protein
MLNVMSTKNASFKIKLGSPYLFVNPVPEFIDPVLGVKMIVFVNISPKRSFSIQSVPIDTGLGLFWTRSVPEFIDPVLGMKMIVFMKTSRKRSFSIQSVPTDASLSLFWMRFGVVFKYWDCVEEKISWFSPGPPLPPPGPLCCRQLLLV